MHWREKSTTRRVGRDTQSTMGTMFAARLGIALSMVGCTTVPETGAGGASGSTTASTTSATATTASATTTSTSSSASTTGSVSSTGAGCTLTQCGSDCVDLSSDDHHCGACDRDCTFGGLANDSHCVASVCDAAELAVKPFGTYCGAPGPGPLFGAPITTIDSDPNLYFGTSDAAYHVAKAGGLPTAFADMDQCGGISHMHRTPTHLSWTRYLGNLGDASGQVFDTTIFPPPLNGTPGSVNVDCGAVSGNATSVTAREAIFVENHGLLHACGANSNGYAYLWFPDASHLEGTNLVENILGVATTDNLTRAWWTSAPGTIRVWKYGTPGAPVAFTDTHIVGLTYGSDALFWTADPTSIGQATQAIVRVPASGLASAAVVLSRPTNLVPTTQSIAADADQVCWLETTGVWCVPNVAAAGTAVHVAKSSHVPQSLTMDADAIYWTEADFAAQMVYVRKVPR